jgi:hypothetical protein
MGADILVEAMPEVVVRKVAEFTMSERHAKTAV